MLPGMEMMGCGDLAVPGDVMRHVVQVESSFNPYAIGVVGGRLVRQPRTLAEATATARMLEEKGYNFSLGLAQVNRYNLVKYGLSSYERAFQTCPNLQAGSRILAECHQRAGGDWGKAFSCYYSGNFVTGFRHGYVQKVMASMGNVAGSGTYSSAAAISLAGQGRTGGRRTSLATVSTESLLARRMQPEPAIAPPVTAPFAAPAEGGGETLAAASSTAAGHVPQTIPGAGQPQVPAPVSGPVKVRLVGAPPIPASAPVLPTVAPAAAVAVNPAVTGTTPPGSVVSGSTASREGSRDEAFVF